jgi:hypothetical protein
MKKSVCIGRDSLQKYVALEVRLYMKENVRMRRIMYEAPIGSYDLATTSGEVKSRVSTPQEPCFLVRKSKMNNLEQQMVVNTPSYSTALTNIWLKIMPVDT